MKNVKITSFFVLSLIFANTAFAQIQIVGNGKSKFGTEWPGNDYNNEVTYEFLGLNSNPYRPGCKIALGDYGSAANGGAQVFVAEAWGWDSDQLQLHGKNGIYLTVGGAGNIIGAELNSSGDLLVKGVVKSQGVLLTVGRRRRSPARGRPPAAARPPASSTRRPARRCSPRTPMPGWRAPRKR